MSEPADTAGGDEVLRGFDGDIEEAMALDAVEAFEPGAPEGEGEGAAEAAGPVLDENDELEEVERDGRTYKVSRGLKDELLAREAYEERLGALGHASQLLEAHAGAVAADQALVHEMAQISTFAHRLSWYETVDWQDLRMRDPDHANELWAAYQQTRLKADHARRGLDEKRAVRAQAETAAEAHRLRSTMAELADPVKGIKGWGPDKFRDLAGFALESGVSPDEIKLATASQWRLLNLAKIGADVLRKQTTVNRHRAAQASTPAHQVRGTGGRSMISPDTDDFAAFEKQYGA